MSAEFLVAARCVNDRSLATLEFFFQKHYQNRFELTSQDKAEVYIVDIDAVHGNKMLEELLAKDRKQSIVALSVHDKDIDGVQMMTKPIKVDVLMKAFDFYYEELQRERKQAAAAREVIPDRSKPEVKQVEKSRQPTTSKKTHISRTSPAKSAKLDIDLSGTKPASRKKTVSDEHVSEEHNVAPVSSSAVVDTVAESSSEIAAEQLRAHPESVPLPGLEPEFKVSTQVGVEKAEQAAEPDVVFEIPPEEPDSDITITDFSLDLPADIEQVSASLANSDSSTDGQGVGELSSIMREYCGSRGDLDPSIPDQLAQLYYQISGYLQVHIQAAIDSALKLRKPVSLILDADKHIVIIPDRGQVACNIKEQVLRARARIRMREDQLKLKVHSHADDVDILKHEGVSYDSVDAFMWKIALWSSYGRVENGTDLNARINLQRWPNFTRLVAVPQFMRIASYWSKGDASLLGTVSALDIPQRYVFSFYSACRALQIVEIATEPASEQVVDPQPQLEQNKRRGLFSRLISHLRSTA